MQAIHVIMILIAMGFVIWTHQYDNGRFYMKNCENCKHEEDSILCEACETCHITVKGYSNWEPKEEEASNDLL